MIGRAWRIFRHEIRRFRSHFQLRFWGLFLFFAWLQFLLLLLSRLGDSGPAADWSWWWVTSPLWGSIALFLWMFLLGGLALAIDSLIRARQKSFPEKRYFQGRHRWREFHLSRFLRIRSGFISDEGEGVEYSARRFEVWLFGICYAFEKGVI